jgi:hypothetical protein
MAVEGDNALLSIARARNGKFARRGCGESQSRIRRRHFQRRMVRWIAIAIANQMTTAAKPVAMFSTIFVLAGSFDL